MKTKLTLNIESKVVRDAKRYSKESKKSLSSIIERYLLTLKGTRKTAPKMSISETWGCIKSADAGKSYEGLREEMYREKYGL